MDKNGWKQLKYWKYCKNDLIFIFSIEHIQLGGINKVVALIKKRAKYCWKRLKFWEYYENDKIWIQRPKFILGGLSMPFWRTKNSPIFNKNDRKRLKFKNISWLEMMSYWASIKKRELVALTVTFPMCIACFLRKWLLRQMVMILNYLVSRKGKIEGFLQTAFLW